MFNRLLLEVAGVSVALLSGLGTGYWHARAEWKTKYDSLVEDVRTAGKAAATARERLEQNHNAKVASERKTYAQRIAASDARTADLLAIVRKQALGGGGPDAGPEGSPGDRGAAGAAGGDVVMSAGEAAVWIARGADRDLAALALCRNTVVNPVYAQ